jgi:hypothetical protein
VPGGTAKVFPWRGLQLVGVCESVIALAATNTYLLKRAP